MDESVINCNFNTEAALYASFMPFVQGGGLFVRTPQLFALGEQVKLSVRLPSETDRHELTAKVVWVTPRGAQGNRPSGCGFMLTGENSRLFLNKIETILAGMLKSNQITDTV